MSAIGTVIAYIVHYNWVLFIVSFLASIKANSLVNERKYSKAKKMMHISFWTAAALTVIIGVVGLITFDFVNLIYAAVWVYISLRSWQQLKQFDHIC